MTIGCDVSLVYFDWRKGPVELSISAYLEKNRPSRAELTTCDLLAEFRATRYLRTAARVGGFVVLSEFERSAIAQARSYPTVAAAR